MTRPAWTREQKRKRRYVRHDIGKRRLRQERDELARLLRVAYDALFFERGMTPQDRDAMRHALEEVIAEDNSSR